MRKSCLNTRRLIWRKLYPRLLFTCKPFACAQRIGCCSGNRTKARWSKWGKELFNPARGALSGEGGEDFLDRLQLVAIGGGRHQDRRRNPRRPPRFDPLAHLRVTTSAMGAAARLIDRIAHRCAGGRWLATGGGGYDVYRVVPRAWALTWLAGAHREAADSVPPAWRERWASEADRYGQAPLPTRFDGSATRNMR